MVPFLRSRLRTVLASCLILVVAFFLLTCHDIPADHDVSSPLGSPQGVFSKDRASTITSKALFDHLDFTEEQCRRSFPLQFSDIDTNLARGSFNFSKDYPDYQGLVQGRIINNTLHILTVAPTNIPQTLHQRTSTLSQIHRALLTSPVLLPNIYFAFAVNDVPKKSAWNYARPNKAARDDENMWLMPPFSSWSWPRPTLGDPGSILSRIDGIEDGLAFTDKIDKVVWRGTQWFNPVGHPSLRKDLLAATKGRYEWADVAALNSSNALAIEEFCRYRYVVYTEGVSYSGRLPYHQACGSVLITAPLTWRTPSALLMRPIFAADLMEVGGGEREKAHKGALETVSRWENANAIYVKPDFSDLQEVVRFLGERVDVAEHIARNQRDMVVAQGYLSTAADTCYWRALIRAWSKVAVVDESEWAGIESERYETWLLKEVTASRTGVRGRIEK